MSYSCSLERMRNVILKNVAVTTAAATHLSAAWGYGISPQSEIFGVYFRGIWPDPLAQER